MNKCTAAQKEKLAEDIYKMTFRTDKVRFTRPGQYAIFDLGYKTETYQVCDYDSRRFTVVYRKSEQNGLSRLEFGAEIEAEDGLGNGFDVDAVPNGAYLVADSMGVAEMLELARCMLTRGKNFKAVLGYSSRADIYMVDSFRNICNEIEVLTLDGSNGRQGMPSDVIRSADYVCASGSPAMLKALAARCKEGQFSIGSLLLDLPISECNVMSKDGTLLSIQDGPVFDKNAVNWDTL